MIKLCSIHGLLTSMLLIVFSLMSNDAIAQKAIRGTVLDEVLASEAFYTYEDKYVLGTMILLSVPASLLKAQQMVLLQELTELLM